MKKVFLIFVAMLCVIYLVNPGAGFIEIIPDNIPFFGNVDEVTVTILLLKVLKELGLNLFKDKAPKEDSIEAEFNKKEEH